MKDQQKQALESFQGNYKQYLLSMKLTTPEQFLEIIVQDTQSLVRYSKIVDNGYIAQQEQFKNIFEEPLDLFDYLVHHFEEVTIDNGFIQFTYTTGTIRKKVKNIMIETVKVELSHLAITERAMEKMKRQLQNELRLHQIQINIFREKLDEKDGEIQRLKMHLAKQQNKNAELEQMIIKQEIKITQLSKRQSKKEQMSQPEQMISYRQPVLNCIAHHPNNIYKKYYTLSTSTNFATKLSRAQENGDFNFINRYQIHPHEKVSYTIKIIKARFNFLLIGFCTQMGLSFLSSYNHPESVYYYCQGSGYLYEGGSYRCLTSGSQAGDKLECIADLPNGKISWLKKGIQIAASSVPSAIKGKILYFSIILHHSGDEVEISF